MKHILFCLVSALFILGCTPENGGNGGSSAANTESPDSISGSELLENLRSEALQEGDRSGRLQASIEPIRTELKTSEAAMDELDRTQVSIDDDCNFVFRNRAEGDIETRVKLTDLDPKGFSLIRDDNPGEFPGVRVRTINNEPLVEVWRNGELITRNNELALKFMDRKSVERVTPVLLQTILICRGDI